ncbi:hypothetical protein PGH12_17315 [Chryseobacterium wangxinyae]|uniref:hypothetical protein n=1 Tax=Chryseobacterium sp. CY350 TaxID=2997336 RepID=UPI00226E61B8|nr:hypothetical protein [Chryseobacterium sp. CY350]MCY0978118.1 hypothetical protein [Chryseobacterium sp. CY350]WBZ95202.1 hypothetical protein PGH12_17315 [Chryseobacterium sp. CY350]
MDQIRAWYFWKNGVKYNVAQYLNVAANNTNAQDNLLLLTKMIVKNGDIYFAGTIKNPNPTSSLDQYQICYWKNGLKTVVSNVSDESIGGFELFNNDIYIATRKNFNYSNLTWDLMHYKNGIVFSSTTNSSAMPEGYFKNSSEMFLLEKHYTNPPYTSSYIRIYKNILTNTTLNIPALITSTPINYEYWNENDKYYVGDDFYYKNNNLIQINDPTGFNRIGRLLVKDQNIYMTRTKNSVVKFFINNVDTMTITDTTKGCFNDIFVVQN